ncbi:MAG: PDZ domain-containing protein [Thermoplasmata archaeon]|nr:PDZ domain-containing protein [Thermoplasmata archaeon]
MAESSSSHPLEYILESFDGPTHRAQFRLRIHGTRGRETRIVLPVWAPGAYGIRDSAREVAGFRVTRAPGDEPVTVDRLSKNEWRIPSTDSAELDVRYSVYGREATDDGLDVTTEHIFLNATRCLPYVVGREKEPIDLVLHLPEGWSAFAELPRVGDHPTRLRAKDYEELVDTPIDCGTPVVVPFRASGVPHQFVICGGPGNYEPHRLEEDGRKLVEATMRFMGGTPLHSYTFFTHLSDKADGGLEHKASTALAVERNCFQPKSSYERFLGLASHEYFHLYNVKRIRPKVLGPFDFTRENYTRLLWWMEGTTDYASKVLLRRAELVTPAKFLEMMADQIRVLETVPGRLVRSLEEASFTAWIDLYQRYEESRNQSVSYYLKGLVVSWCLDLEIRHRTENRLSLDDVFRHLWTEYGRPERGIDDDAFQGVVEKFTALDLGPFFEQYVRGTKEIDANEFARYAGLRVGPAPKEPNPSGEPEEEKGFLGIEFSTEGSRLKVTVVLDGGPARRAGISPGDEIVAIEKIRVAPESFDETWKRYPPGSTVELTFFRRGLLTSATVTTTRPPPAKYKFHALESPTPLQKSIYEGWTNSKWVEAAPKSPTPA